jgi:hypothetical protein
MTSTMSFQQSFTHPQIEEKIQLAIIAIETQEFKSIRDTAVHFEVQAGVDNCT